LLVGLVVVLGVGLRGARIGSEPLWVDEAESSINGLTLLRHGVPVDHYLGMPLFENVMYRPWPDDAKYEFKDLSYSDRGVAVYHGWLPLYAIAVSQWIFGMTPDELESPPRVLHDRASLLRRTWVPRLPALLFSAVFLVLMYVTGRSMAGEAAGWAALVFTALCERIVWFGFQARYYSPTLCMDALCAWLLWRCICRGRTRDFVFFGSGLVLLFHTHSLSSMAVLLTAFAVLPLMREQAHLLAKTTWAAVVFVIGCVPWAWLSGLLQHAVRLPPARELLRWPDDVAYFTIQRLDAAALILVSLLCFLFAREMQRRGGPVGWDDLRRAQRGATLCILWLILAYATFFLCMPAASFYWVRMTMTLEVPAILLIAGGLSVATRSLAPRFAPALAVLVMVTFLVTTGRLVTAPKSAEATFEPIGEMVAELDRRTWDPATEFYASPNFHLVLTYYTGLPVQSIAPVRTEYLDQAPGPWVYMAPYLMLHGAELDDAIQAAASRADLVPDAQQLKSWRSLVNRRLYYELMLPRVGSIDPEPILPDFLQSAMAAARKIVTADASPRWVNAECPIMLRDFVVNTYEQWWMHYFYRFVDSQRRMGENANFAKRLRTAKMELLVPGYALCFIPPLADRAEPPATPPP
jgi:hypothetical protein